VENYVKLPTRGPLGSSFPTEHMEMVTVTLERMG
jgi:hypothetical protein